MYDRDELLALLDTHVYGHVTLFPDQAKAIAAALRQANEAESLLAEWVRRMRTNPDAVIEALSNLAAPGFTPFSASPTWVDLSSRLRSASWSIGRDDEFEQFPRRRHPPRTATPTEDSDG